MKKNILTMILCLCILIPIKLNASSGANIVNIEDKSEGKVTNQTKQYLCQDKTYNYYLPSHKGEYITVSYENDIQENILEAVEGGPADCDHTDETRSFHIMLLEEYGIEYIKEPREELEEYKFDELFSYIGKDDTIDIKNIKIADPSIYNSELSVYWDLEYAKVIRYYIESLPEVKAFYKEKPNMEYAPIVYCNNKKTCEISFRGVKLDAFVDAEGYTYPGETIISERKTYNINLEITKDYDKELLKKVYEGEIIGFDYDTEVTSGRIIEYPIFDLQLINIDYNSKEDNFWNKLYSTEGAELYVPEIRQAYENYPELTFKSINSDAGDYGDVITLTKSGDYLIFKDNIFYGYKPIGFSRANILLISDKIEKTSEAYVNEITKRIKNYLNDESVNITFRELEPFEPEDTERLNAAITKFLNNALGTETTYSGARENVVNLYRIEGETIEGEKFGGDYFVVPVSEEKIKEVEFKSKNKATGIIVLSKSYDLPLDAMLTIKDVLKQMKDKQIISAFDITLYSQIKEAKVTNIKNGIKIFIPVTKDFKIDGKKIYYIDDNGKKKTEYKIELETIDGKQYISFITNHLSTYALIDENIENPKTGVFSPLTSLFMLAVGGFILYWSTKTKENFEEL